MQNGDCIKSEVIKLANEQNLRPFTSDQDREEAKKNGQKGGIASGKARKEKATMKKALEMLLDEKSNKGLTYREMATLGLIKGAVKGNAQNYKLILDMLGESDVSMENAPGLKIEIVKNDYLEEKKDE